MKIQPIYPADDFNHILEEAKNTYEFAVIIGYDDYGVLTVRGGGMNGKLRPTAKDWLFLIEQFKRNLLNGNYSEDE